MTLIKTFKKQLSQTSGENMQKLIPQSKEGKKWSHIALPKVLLQLAKKNVYSIYNMSKAMNGLRLIR